MKKTIIILVLLLIAVCAFAQNYSLDFDGVDDYVDMGDVELFDFSTDINFSIGAWVKTDETDINNGIVTKADNSSYFTGYCFWISGVGDVGRLGFHYNDGSYTALNVFSNAYVNDGYWHHVFVTVERGINGTVKLYIDGQLDISESRDMSFDISNTASLAFGKDRSNGRYEGLIDNISIWDYALTQSEIQDNMYNELTGNEPGLVGYWNFNEGVGSTLYDQTANGNNGTIYGATWQTSGVPIPTDLKLIRNGTLSQTSGFLTISASSISSPHFVAFGHNNEELSSIVNCSVTGYNQRLSRIWFVDNYGVTTPTLTFVLETTPSSSSISDYGLIKSSSSDMSSASEVMTATSVNTGTKTITFELSAKASLDDGYYTVGSKGSATLPVTLSSFIAQFIGSSPILCWTTQSETGNAGWNAYRSETDILEEAFQINADMIPGAGTIAFPTEYTYVDEYEVISNFTYYYWIESISYSGETESYGPISLLIPEEGEEPGSPGIPAIYGLYQNYPNPFNPNTNISFAINEDTYGSLSIFNLKGQQIITLFEGEIPQDEVLSFIWDSKDNLGSSVSSGLYFYKIESAKYSEIRKMILLK